jgi:Tfp pilus assembly protein PilX
MALITALLYLLIIGFLSTSAFSTSVLQTKMSAHWNAEIHAFTQAESALHLGESAITPDTETGEGALNENASYQFKKQSDAVCGLLYAVSAKGNAAAATVQLESVFFLPSQPFPEGCKDKDSRAMPHRVMWRQVED